MVEEKADYKLLADTAVLAGEIMLRNGAETNLVEETIEKILKTEDVKHVEAVVMTTSIIATISDPDITPITVVRRIRMRDTNLSKICMVNELTNKFINRQIDLESMFNELRKIPNYVPYKWWLKDICTMLIPPLFVIMLEGKSLDIATALICGALLVLIKKFWKRLETNEFIVNFFITMIISVVAVLGSKILEINADLVIIGTIMPLVPGVAITNATMDTLNGDYMSGIAKLLETAVKAASIAIGVGAGIGIMKIGGII